MRREFDWFTSTDIETDRKGQTAATQKCSITEYYKFTSDDN